MDTKYDSHIEQIVQSIFVSMLGMETARVPEQPEDAAEMIWGTIQIAGGTPLNVVLGMSQPLARSAAAYMLAMPVDDVADDDAKDVVAEVANMIGGNLKSLLPGPVFLSLPTVVGGRNVAVQVPGAELTDDVSLSCDAGELRVRLYAPLPSGEET